MKTALIGATGHVGSEILGELARRGHQVTAISRHTEKTPEYDGVVPVAGDITAPDELAEILKGHDAVLSATVFLPGSSEAVIAAVRGSGVKRFIAVGGAGSLDAGGGKRIAEVMDIPEAWRPFILEGVRYLDLLREVHDFDWTFISPAEEIGPGERLGQYRTSLDTPVKDAAGHSRISYADYAIAFVDELEKPQHIFGRFTVGY